MAEGRVRKHAPLALDTSGVAKGYLTPVQSALLQKVIDVAVILDALRALRIVPGRAVQISGDSAIAVLAQQPQGIP